MAWLLTLEPCKPVKNYICRSTFQFTEQFKDHHFHRVFKLCCFYTVLFAIFLLDAAVSSKVSKFILSDEARVSQILLTFNRMIFFPYILVILKIANIYPSAADIKHMLLNPSIGQSGIN